ncbi:MAG TPA: tRNA (guanosine(37)-N1)-methyltransferase TrmD [Patescibacteria group bacterium]|nr:tRNA (guanosine(37)-N1)-methyltransferase TrmD [Patescibacteria group bacterium]
MKIEPARLTIKVITLFPEMFPGHLGLSLSGRAFEKGVWSLETFNPRYYTTDNHKTVDDSPFGGGAGMVMKPDILDRALQAHQPLGRFIYMTPRGRPLTQAKAVELSKEPLLTILCGRYEGVDERLLEAYQAEEISVGDYVLSGGEQAAMILLDAVIRLLPDVVGNMETHEEESFGNGLLEYPHYTRPAEWTGPDGILRKVPEILASGHHAKVKEWRLEQSKAVTRERRPDLWQAYLLQNPDDSKKTK